MSEGGRRIKAHPVHAYKKGNPSFVALNPEFDHAGPPGLEEKPTVVKDRVRRVRQQRTTRDRGSTRRPLWQAKNDGPLVSLRDRGQCGNSAPTDG